MPRTDQKGASELLPGEALRQGWRWWSLLMSAMVLGLLLVVLLSPGAAAGASAILGLGLLGLSVLWLLVLGGVVLILRSYCFRAVWDGRAVEPGSYLKGMYQVWGVWSAGGLLSVLAALLMGAVFPGVLVVLMVVLLLGFSRPSGRALGV